MNKTDFINEVAKRCMITKYVVEEIYNVSGGIIAEKLISGEDVDVPQLGKFTTRTKQATTYKNLFGEKEKYVQESTYPIFKICSPLKTRIKNGFKYNKIS